MNLAFTTLAVLALLAMSHCPSRSEDAKCGQIRQLRVLYAGVVLNDNQRASKREIVAWYRANCRNKSR